MFNISIQRRIFSLLILNISYPLNEEGGKAFAFFGNFKVMFVLGITKLCTHLHPSPSTSTQLISTSSLLHPPPPSSFQPHPSSTYLHQAHFNLIPAPPTSTQLISACTQLSATPSTIFESKYCT